MKKTKKRETKDAMKTLIRSCEKRSAKKRSPVGVPGWFSWLRRDHRDDGKVLEMDRGDGYRIGNIGHCECPLKCIFKNG